MRLPKALSPCPLLFVFAAPVLAGNPNNLNDANTLCLDLRWVPAASPQGFCQSDDSECPVGQQCTDNDGDPLNGALCIEHACVGLDQQVVVDVELGPTFVPACGAQLFLEWDTAALELDSVQPDPQGELQWPLALLDFIDVDAGTVDLAISLLVGVPCDAATGTFDGGTVARLNFTAITPCNTFGVRFRKHDPPSKIGGPSGAIPISGCNNEFQPSDTDPISIAAAALWNCPQITTCNPIHFYDPISLFDDCDQGLVPPVTSLCTADRFFLCDQDLDCGFGGLCETESDCDAHDRPGFNSQCIPHPDGTPINVCTVDECTDGLCKAPLPLDVADWLDCTSGCVFPPGLTRIACAYTNDCGYTSQCVVDVPVGYGESHAFCDDGYACTHDSCNASGGCSNVAVYYGDTTGDHNVDLEDVLCVLDAFRGVFSESCIRSNCDIGLCGSDGTIDLIDILAVLDGFQGSVQCCTDPIGACCTPEGCINRPELVCSGGIYLGDGTNCATAACVGACCTGTQCIDSATGSGCLAVGGAYQGQGTSCAKIACPVPTGACCLAGGCQDAMALKDCIGSGGVYQGHETTCAIVGCGAEVHVTINEIRINQPDQDDDEYFELAGPPGAALDGLRYVVIGDGFGGSGEVEAVIGLDGYAIGKDGFFLAAESSFSFPGATPDLTTVLNFENFDNVTHLLVSSATVYVGMDLDVDDDGVLDMQPWAKVLDLIAVIEQDNPPTTTEYHYGPPTVGPDGSLVPGHVYRCPNGTGSAWHIGPFDMPGGLDTPGGSNACPPPCADDDDCQDGVFCNGQESCVAGYCQPGAPVNCDDGAVCTGDYCNEATGACEHQNVSSCSPWINEIHYNDAGGDLDEGVEIAGPAGIDLSGWQVVAYDGGSGHANASLLLAGVIPHLASGFGMRWFGLAPLQDGAPDGVALVDDSGALIEFLSYGGVMTAVDGPAAGATSIDIGVVETPSTPAGFSLQRQGTGTQAADFTWAPPSPQTRGAVNQNQTFAQGCLGPSDCTDGLFCNGQELCIGGLCQPGAPVTCNDGLDCTVDFCDEINDTCGIILNQPACNNGLYCDGLEYCDAALGCQSGNPPNCNDGVACTVDVCDENSDSCTHTPNNALCSDGNFCNGAETCDAVLGCQPGTPVNCAVWINELHYDNDGVDVNEGVEVAGAAGTNLAGWTLVGYNGAQSGAMYQVVSLSGVIPSMQNGKGVLWFPFVGLQNGGADGVALVDPGQSVVQFISYEGTLTAADGPAQGMTSEDIGVAEPPTTPVGLSLQLQGSGSIADDFTWAPAAPHTRGAINNNQTFE